MQIFEVLCYDTTIKEDHCVLAWFKTRDEAETYIRNISWRDAKSNLAFEVITTEIKETP